MKEVDYSFVIRRAVVSDAQNIKEIMLQSFIKYKSDAEIPGQLEAMSESIKDIENDITNKNVYIAFIDNIPVGSIRVEIRPDSSAYLTRFGVCPEYNKMGVGIALMSLVDKLMISHCVKRLTLHTASKNKDLIRFYYGRGFYIESTINDSGYIRALLVKNY